MPRLNPLFTCVLLLSAAPVAAARRGEQDAVFQARQSGASLPLRTIEGGVVPQMKQRGADYIGAEYDALTTRYRLKFMRDGSVIWVDVDGRTGTVLGRAGD